MIVLDREFHKKEILDFYSRENNNEYHSLGFSYSGKNTSLSYNPYFKYLLGLATDHLIEKCIFVEEEIVDLKITKISCKHKKTVLLFDRLKVVADVVDIFFTVRRIDYAIRTVPKHLLKKMFNDLDYYRDDCMEKIGLKKHDIEEQFVKNNYLQVFNALDGIIDHIDVVDFFLFCSILQEAKDNFPDDEIRNFRIGLGKTYNWKNHNPVSPYTNSCDHNVSVRSKDGKKNYIVGFSHGFQDGYFNNNNVI